MILGTGVKVKSVGAWYAMLLLLCLCAHSWGSCFIYYSNPAGTTCYSGWQNDFGSCEGKTCGLTDCSKAVLIGGPECNMNRPHTWNQVNCKWSVCTTQAEADSVACALNPTLPNCAVVSDTLIFACSDSFVNGQAVATIYRLSCKATNGELTECNGKQDVDIATDGQPVKQMSGTCAQNGLPNGPFGGASPQDSTTLPNGANSECFAITGSTCHMRDKVSGNTFTCDCDGSCQVAIQNLMAGNASCTNPYPQPTSASDSISFGSSGSGGGSSPSSSEGGSSPSSSGSESSPSSSGDDFEYDYTAVLEAIRANTQYTGNEVNELNGKANTANEYLRQIANKDWNPTINVGSPNVNVTLNADTAQAPAQILGLLNEKLSGGEPNSNDTAGMGSRLDGYLSSIDSIVGEGTPDMSDSIGNAVQGIHTAYNAVKDSLGNSSFNDSLAKWNGLLTNNGVITGSGSNNCPSILTQQFTWAFPLGGSTINIQVGTLGKYICTPISPFNVTIWQFCRVILRAMVAIGCMLWLYKAVLGIDGGNSEED